MTGRLRARRADSDAGSGGWTRLSHYEPVLGGDDRQHTESVVEGGSGLVAVGYDGSDGAVWTSAGGLSWSRGPDDDGVLGGNGLMAVAAEGQTIIVAGGTSGMRRWGTGRPRSSPLSGLPQWQERRPSWGDSSAAVSGDIALTRDA